MKTRTFAGLLAGVMLAVTALTPMTALAAEPENGKITYNAGEGYTFEKISHPTKGTMSADGIVDYIGDGKVEVITDTNDSNYNAGDRGQSSAGLQLPTVIGSMWALAMRQWAAH